MKIVLASSSPRRKELLRKTGLDFESEAPNFEEDMGLDLPPKALAEHLSLGKARSLASKYKDALIIGVDTFVVLDKELLGKPKHADDARAMLRKLSGRGHSVISGLSFVDTVKGTEMSVSEETKLFFKNLSENEIDEYVASGEPLDKAGSYGIQGIGRAFVEKIEGDFFNVMGVPMKRLIAILNERFNIAAELPEGY